MFSVEICHLLERFCSIVVFVKLLYTFVLQFALFTPEEPRGWNFLPPNPRGWKLWTGVASLIWMCSSSKIDETAGTWSGS